MFVKITVYTGMIVLACLLAFFFLPDAYLDKFLKGRITGALEDAYPAYSIQIAGLHYSIIENRLECDSVRLMRVDSTFSCSIVRFSVSGVGRIQLLWGGGVAPDNLVSSDASAENIVLTFPLSGYELRCAQMQISVPDSEIVADNLELRTLTDDDQFFAASRFRRTRFHLDIPYCSVKGSACLSLIAGEIQCARVAEIRDPVFDVLINKDKPYAVSSLRPPMPNELLPSIMKTIQLDSVNITNGRMTYGERYPGGSKPALLTFDSLQILAGGFSNHVNHSDTLVIRAEGKLMQSGMLTLFMIIPVASPEFSYQYSGSLSEMDLNKLNPFLEIAEHKRFKTGLLHSVAFDIHVIAGQATGNVRASYKDLKLVSIDGRTGSESGVGNTITSFLTNNIKLRTTNLPDKSGSMKIGEVKYTRAHDDAFLQFSWFALRSGVGDVVGF